MIDHVNYTARIFLLFEQCFLFLNLTVTSLLSSLPPVFFFSEKSGFYERWFQVERLRGKKNCHPLKFANTTFSLDYHNVARKAIRLREFTTDSGARYF